MTVQRDRSTPSHGGGAGTVDTLDELSVRIDIEALGDWDPPQQYALVPVPRTVAVPTPRRADLHDVAKRAFDLVFSLAVLVLTAPLFALLCAAVRLSSPGPILYGHVRVGRGGRAFRCWKFRTMVVDADEQLRMLFEARPDLREEFEQAFKLRQDPRVTRVGQFLRKTSLDELPQFFNVLRGDMSVVGPRPLVVEETARYGHALAQVLRVRPGITGLWQVSGRNDVPYAQRIVLDARYAARRSLLFDLLIVVRTLGVLLPWSRNGAY